MIDEVPSILEDVKKIPLYFFYLSNILLGRDASYRYKKWRDDNTQRT